MPMPRENLASSVLIGAILVAIVATGVVLRLEQPLSSPALGAEDPFTHVVFTKEAVARGAFGDSKYLGTGMYPPGLHAFVGTIAPLAGVSIYDFARFSPVVFGVLAVVGTFLLAARLGGLAAGLAAAFFVATMPEHVFRSNLLFPTMVDLAVLPAWLLLFVLATTYAGGEGAHRVPERVGAGLAFALLSIPLALLHPWVVPLFAFPMLVYAAIRVVRERQGFLVSARRLLPAAALTTTASALAMASRWDKSDTGFSDLFANFGPLAFVGEIQMPIPALFVMLLGVLGVVSLIGVIVTAVVSAAARWTPRSIRIGLGVIAGLVVLASMSVMAGKPVQEMGLRFMLGETVLALAIVGVFVAALAPTRLGDLGLAIVVLLYPLTRWDVFDGGYWPERTVVYLSIGAAFLAAHVVGAVVRGIERLASRLPAATGAAATVAALLVVAGTTFAQPSDPYPWYMLYEEDEFEVLDRVADTLDADPRSRVVAYPWQPSLLVKALAENPPQVRYGDRFFNDAERGAFLKENPGKLYVLADKHLDKRAQKYGFDVSFLEGSGYRLVDANADRTIRVYEVMR